ALPNQLVDPKFVDVEGAFELARSQVEIGRPDGLVRFLSVLDAWLMTPWRVVVLATEHAANDAGRFLQRFVRQRGGVGAVIRDQPALRVHGVEDRKSVE